MNPMGPCSVLKPTIRLARHKSTSSLCKKAKTFLAQLQNKVWAHTATVEVHIATVKRSKSKLFECVVLSFTTYGNRKLWRLV